MAGTVLLAYYFEYTDTFPVHIQGFFCFDKTFSKPYPGPDESSNVPPVLVYSLVAAIPTITREDWGVWRCTAMPPEKLQQMAPAARGVKALAFQHMPELCTSLSWHECPLAASGKSRFMICFASRKR
ncbi:phospholipid phosphatase-related type 5-like isoform X2 [Labeo rohita]|uniref:Phospholipid phosphatase-related type 5-like isoform X2 n=1 Tax=Labeo rohita TaxID=84645 RepID=A0A498NPW4_LABRO|nr:phospholipid phosphatase-related type 5-like isoform X2 [Labeo rohita]